jgi:hypothetical protein
MLRRIFGGKNWREAGENNVMGYMYPSPNIIEVIKLRIIRWAGYVARMGEINSYKIFVGKPDGKIPLKKT